MADPAEEPTLQITLKKHCMVAVFFQPISVQVFWDRNFEFMANKCQQQTLADLHKYLNTVVSYQYVE